MTVVDPVLSAVVEAAVGATGASTGWLVARRDERLIAVAGAGSGLERVGEAVDPTGSAALALASGQPSARTPRRDDPSARGAGGHPDVPATLLCVPCGDLGALEVADRASGSFTVDDVEIVTILADVAAAALSQDDRIVAVPEAEVLAADLRTLSAVDPRRYASVAPAVSALLGHSV